MALRGGCPHVGGSGRNDCGRPFKTAHGTTSAKMLCLIIPSSAGIITPSSCRGADYWRRRALLIWESRCSLEYISTGGEQRESSYSSKADEIKVDEQCSNTSVYMRPHWFWLLKHRCQPNNQEKNWIILSKFNISTSQQRWLQGC